MGSKKMAALRNIWEKLTSCGEITELQQQVLINCNMKSKLLAHITHPHGPRRSLTSYENYRLFSEDCRIDYDWTLYEYETKTNEDCVHLNPTERRASTAVPFHC